MQSNVLEKVTESNLTFKRWGYTVEGWYHSPFELEERAGVFIIATQGFMMPFVLDVDESSNIREAVMQHERRAFWRRNALGSLLYSVIYTEDAESVFLSEFMRQNIVQHIRSTEQPVFGGQDVITRSQSRL